MIGKLFLIENNPDKITENTVVTFFNLIYLIEVFLA